MEAAEESTKGHHSGDALAKLLALVRFGIWTLSLTLLAFVALAYWRRFDTCTVVTLFPPWCWTAIGLALTWFGLSHRCWRLGAALAVAWLVFLALFADSPASLVRSLLPHPERSENLRVVSLNCAGVAAAATDVAALQPDIILFQESPTRDAMVALAEQLYGTGDHLHTGPDASIVARGTLTPIEVPAPYRGNFVHARVATDNRSIDVISLRLYPCPVRLDLWSSDAWRYYRANRETRRRQLSQIAAYIATLPPESPLVVGGDFNCPPGDAVFRFLRPRLSDAFPVAGRGWGATIIDLAGWPLIRIDQIWTSYQLRAQNAFALRTSNSDHHMAVADFAATQ
jgi:endonuclease/exonuclease/phosphatase (EEP) superfamily protein YafD